jgi:glutaminyl-tRNA synthetase
MEDLNPRSLEIVRAKVEPSLAGARAGDRFQFERLGYFYADPDTKPGAPVFNRVVPLKDSWAKIVKRGDGGGKDTGGKEPGPRKERKAERAAQGPAPGKAAKVELSPDALRWKEAHGLSDETARVIAQEPLLAKLLTEAAATPASPSLTKAVALLLVNDVLGLARSKKLDSVPFGGAALVEVANLIEQGTLSSAQAKEVLAEMTASGQAPREIVARKDLAQIKSNDALEPLVAAVLTENADAVERYRAGNTNVLGALVGMVMKKSGGRANAKVVSELLTAKLG